MKKAANITAAVRVLMEAEVSRQVRQHGRSSMKAEVCGVLIGREEGHTTIIEACIAGANAAQGGAHVTFTQDTWEHIYQIKDQKYPEARIVGWYHSHPGFGVFLSDHDLFIHKNFFSSPQQVAWVYDPHSDEEGCFGWLGERIERVDDVSFRFKQPVGESLMSDAGDTEPVKVSNRRTEEKHEGSWMPFLRDAALAVAFFVVGAVAAFFFISSQAHLLPRGGPALVYVDQEHIAIVPPDLANQILIMLKAQVDGQMKAGQFPPSATQPAQPNVQQGGTDGRKK